MVILYFIASDTNTVSLEKEYSKILQNKRVFKLLKTKNTIIFLEIMQPMSTWNTQNNGF